MDCIDKESRTTCTDMKERGITFSPIEHTSIFFRYPPPKYIVKCNPSHILF